MKYATTYLDNRGRTRRSVRRSSGGPGPFSRHRARHRSERAAQRNLRELIIAQRYPAGMT